jgi:NADPH:quinone reductase-like Zn-dependent oxidoreductase
MKAILLEKAGGVKNLIIKDVKNPVANEQEVLVEVKAISINPVDYKVRAYEAVLDMICGPERPVILGWDIAGIVVSVGDRVTKFKAGDSVFGMIDFPGRGNSYAELVAAPENQLAKMPENVSFEEAAATTLAALTALQVLAGRVKKDDRVLIHAGSGGVGHFAIQIAKTLGAYVISTSSAKNRDFIMSLGADEHIDYREVAFEENTTDIDFVLDGMGEDVLLNSLKVMKQGGAIVSLPTPVFSDEIQQEAKNRNVNVEFVLVHSSGEDMNTLQNMLAAGTLKATVSKTFPFAEMAQAHTEVESGRTVGKVVVKV